jgi:spermidine synthase
MKLLAFTVSFLLAFLLFAVQPMATKMVLPTLGGTPAVWNTAMLTFQLLLLAGYAYAHWLGTRVRLQYQWLLHATLILASFTLLPLSLTLDSSDALMQHPIAHLAAAFILQIGLPFFVLSATAPLLQNWVSRSNHPLSKTPYVLYSASNLGSMMGLLGYVLLVEPLLTLPEQRDGWSLLYVLGTALLLIAGWVLSYHANAPAKKKTKPKKATAKPEWKTCALWIWLAFLPSSLSLGVTSYITTDIASVPLLWVIPLALYLLSFVDAFRTRPILVPIAQRIAPLLGMMALIAYGLQAVHFSEIFIFQLLVFALLAFALHGWLAKFKPDARYLTQFYFCMSIGGALGGVLNALVAPWIFTDTVEYPLSLLLASVTAFLLWNLFSESKTTSAMEQVHIFRRVAARVILIALSFYLLISASEPSKAGLHTINNQTLMMTTSFAGLITLVLYRRYLHGFYTCAAVCIIMLFVMTDGVDGMTLRFKERNFFGVERVLDQPSNNTRYMMHNTTVHGVQMMDAQAQVPLSYYYALRGAFDALPVAHRLPIGAVGLGAGTVQCYAHAGQQVDFYEINPLVIQLAEDASLFRYLSDCPGSHRMMLGDGRIRLGDVETGRYGVLILDAFSSDAIPAHLLTEEALRLYFDKLAPHGVLLIHTTNRHMNLWPILATQAKAIGAVAYGNNFKPPVGQKRVFETFWVAMARNDHDLQPLLQREKSWSPLVPDDGALPWTDDYINVIPYFKMFRRDS